MTTVGVSMRTLEGDPIYYTARASRIFGWQALPEGGPHTWAIRWAERREDRERRARHFICAYFGKGFS